MAGPKNRTNPNAATAGMRRKWGVVAATTGGAPIPPPSLGPMHGGGSTPGLLRRPGQARNAAVRAAIGSPQNPTGQAPGAPLPPSLAGLPTSVNIFGGTGTGAGWTIGPTAASLASTNFGAFAGTSGLASPYLGAGLAAWYAAGKPAFVASIPMNVPVQPTLTLGGALAGVPPGYAAGTAASAASGHPLGIANQAVLTLAQRLQTQAAYVSRYVGAAAAQEILTGAHLAA